MTNCGAQLYNLSESDLDLDTVVWRYLPFSKFVSMISYEALWFCRLSFLTDKFEGTLPYRTFEKTKAQDDVWKSLFTHPDHQREIEEWAERNVEDGQSLIAVNCWFIGDDESERMWQDYVVSSEGVAIRSTIRKLRESIYLPRDFSFIGRVNYVDFDQYEMTLYEGAQAHHRAFLKDRVRFEHEQELRILTMNFRTDVCLDPLGRPLTHKELVGGGMNNFHEPGIHVRVKLDQLFDTIVVAPGAQDWFYNLMQHIQIKAGINWQVRRSKFGSRT